MQLLRKLISFKETYTMSLNTEVKTVMTIMRLCFKSAHNLKTNLTIETLCYELFHLPGYTKSIFC